MFTKLVGLQYKVVYKKSVENGVADALSRRGHSDSQLLALSAATPAWVSEVINSYEQDNHAASIISKLLLDPAAVPHFTLCGWVTKVQKPNLVGTSALLAL
jgi:hypothetical protein